MAFRKDPVKYRLAMTPTGGRPVAVPVNPRVPQRPVALPQSMTLGRAEPPTGKRTSRSVPHEGLSAFLAGTHTNLTSSWLRACQFEPRFNQLRVWFLDGYSCTVHDVSPDEAAGLFQSPSSGGWWHDVVLGSQYVQGKPITAAKRWTPGV